MEIHDDNALVIYTDGSCKNKPRRGGYAFILVSTDDAGEEVTYEYKPPGILGATNNEMELKACIEALRLATSKQCPVPAGRYEKIVVFTDSKYLIDGIQLAEGTWPHNGWLTRESEPVQSPDLWKELLQMKRRARRIEFKKVKAHKSNPYNKRVDRLAKESADLADRTRRAPGVARRKISARETEPRMVPMKGQTETIRIVSVRPISARHHSYRYEVIDDKSESFGLLDEAFALNKTVAMRGAHIYVVRFSESGKGRWVEEVVKEVERR
jgi:ribonuclease HI